MSSQLCKDIKSNFQHWLRKQLPARMFTTNAKIHQDNFAQLDYLNYRIKGMCNLARGHDELYISCSLFFYQRNCVTFPTLSFCSIFYTVIL